MIKLENFGFGGTGNITFDWYCLRGATALKDIYIASNVIVDSRGFADINSDTVDRVTVHVPGADVPDSWPDDWAFDQVSSGKMVVV